MCSPRWSNSIVFYTQLYFKMMETCGPMMYESISWNKYTVSVQKPNRQEETVVDYLQKVWWSWIQRRARTNPATGREIDLIHKWQLFYFYRDWKRSSGWLESWEGLLLVSLTTVLLRTPITQMIFFNHGMLLLGSNHFLVLFLLCYCAN